MASSFSLGCQLTQKALSKGTLSSLFQLPTPIRVLVRMAHTLPIRQPLSLFQLVRHLKDPRTRKMIMRRLDRIEYIPHLGARALQLGIRL